MTCPDHLIDNYELKECFPLEVKSIISLLNSLKNGQELHVANINIEDFQYHIMFRFNSLKNLTNPSIEVTSEHRRIFYN